MKIEILSDLQYFSYIVEVSFIGGGNKSTRRKPLTCCKSLTNCITKCCIEYTSPWTGFELTTLVVIGTDCTGTCKSNYHTITTMTGLSMDMHKNVYQSNLKKIILHRNRYIKMDIFHKYPSQAWYICFITLDSGYHSEQLLNKYSITNHRFWISK